MGKRKSPNHLFTSEYQPENANRFSSSNQPSNPGRKTAIYNILKDKGYSKDDIRRVFEEMFWYTEAEARKVANDKDMPLIARITSKAMLESMRKKNIDMITRVFEYVLGKPDAKIHLKAEQEKRLNEFMQEAQEIDYEDVSSKVGPPVQSEDGYKSILQEFKERMQKEK